MNELKRDSYPGYLLRFKLDQFGYSRVLARASQRQTRKDCLHKMIAVFLNSLSSTLSGIHSISASFEACNETTSLRAIHASAMRFPGK